MRQRREPEVATGYSRPTADLRLCLIKVAFLRSSSLLRTMSADQPAGIVDPLRQAARYVATGLFVGLFACLAIAEPRCADLDTRQGCKRYAVSLIQLIANPSQFDGKRVVVGGFLSLEFEGHALYLHQDDFRVGNTSNAVALELPENWFTSTASIDCPNNRYVQLEGEFGMNNGHFGLFAGSLKYVERCRQRSVRALE